MSENAVAILLRANSGRLLLTPTRAPLPDGWDLPLLRVGRDVPLTAAQRRLCQAYQLEFPLEMHGSIQFQLGLAGQPSNVQLLRSSTPNEAEPPYEHRWVKPRQLTEFALGPLLSHLWQHHALDDL